MWLEYGVAADGELVHVGDVGRGRTTLGCPYCGGTLIARHGTVLAWHFAHGGASCHAATRPDDLIALPLFERFHLQLRGKDLAALTRWAAGAAVTGLAMDRLKACGMLVWNQWARGGRGAYTLTKQGQVVTGDLSLRLFAEMQEPLIAAHHATLLARAQGAWEQEPNSVALTEALMDLDLYRAQLRRVLGLTLYLVEVTAPTQTVYKIGVTARAVDERVAELASEVRPHLGPVTVRVLRTWPHRGSIEPYFKHRYAAHQLTLGQLTEYFAFDAPTLPRVLRDVSRLPQKVLTALDQAVLANEPHAVAQAMAAAAQATHHRTATIAGMAAARARGVHVGRPPGATESRAAFQAKWFYQHVVTALQAGLSLRAAAQAVGVSVNTVRKVQRVLQGEWDDAGGDE